jgi:HEAT repeat protein
LLHFDDIRDSAVFTLGCVGPAARQAVPALIEVLKRDPTSLAPQVLGQLGSAAAEAIPSLRAALDSDSASLRLAAARALKTIWPSPGKRIVRIPSNGCGEALW